MADPVDVNTIALNSQALTVDIAGKAFVSQMGRQALIADKKFDEVDAAQSSAIRYLTTGTPNESTAMQGRT